MLRDDQRWPGVRTQSTGQMLAELPRGRRKPASTRPKCWSLSPQHGGCWPGPPPETKLNTLVNEVISGFALLNMAHSFKDAAVAKQVRSIAAESLNKSLPAVQHSIYG